MTALLRDEIFAVSEIVTGTVARFGWATPTCGVGTMRFWDGCAAGAR
jgi:hypothetical protein